MSWSFCAKVPPRFEKLLVVGSSSALSATFLLLTVQRLWLEISAIGSVYDAVFPDTLLKIEPVANPALPYSPAPWGHAPSREDRRYQTV